MGLPRAARLLALALIGGCCGAGRATLPAGPAPAARSLTLADRCALLGDILTLRVRSAGAEGTWSAAEDESVRRLAEVNEQLVVSATVGQPGAEQPLFSPGERCGDRLSLRLDGSGPGAPPGYLALALAPRGADTFDWRLALAASGQERPPASRPALPLAGTARRGDRGWRVEAAGQNEARARRPLDPEPRRSALASPVPAGRAVAFFEFDTGGDIMGAAAKEAGLVLVVRAGAQEWRQTIASCAEPARGSALGGAVGSIDLAECDGRHEIVSEPGVVRVEKRVGSGGPVTVTTVRLPDPKVRAVAPGSMKP
jgi:hypothetical protein